MIIKKFIIIFLLAFTLNVGLQNQRMINNSPRHILVNVIGKNYTKDNEEFIKRIEKKRFAEMIKLYINILEINKHTYYYNTS